MRLARGLDAPATVDACMTRRNVKIMPDAPTLARVESLSHDGRGVARVNGKTVFIEGALPGEQVLFKYVTQRRNFDEGDLQSVVEASPLRVAPRCPHAAVCGGCTLQHMEGTAQILSKQKILLDALTHIGGVTPESVMPPLTGPLWGYRRRARLGAKFVIKKEAMLVGFREKRSNLLAELSRCDVLHPAVGTKIEALRELLRRLEAYNRIPQIEVAVADNATALVFRNLVPLSETDKSTLAAFGEELGFYIYLQPGGIDSVSLLWPAHGELLYRMPAFNLEMEFRPNDFIQVNGEMNLRMVSRAMEWLAPEPHSRVLDLFCGLGNFTLPIARRAAEAVGVEGDLRLVRAAQDNARRNGIANTTFHVADLAGDCGDAVWARGQKYDQVLLDPPRAGAAGLIPLLPRLAAARIVYVSCDPGTLARDAGELVNRHGYRLRAAGVMDMFPHTTHVESIAVFER